MGGPTGNRERYTCNQAQEFKFECKCACVWDMDTSHDDFIIIVSFSTFITFFHYIRTIMKSSTGVVSTADRLKQWKSEKSSTTKENSKQQPGTKRPVAGSSSSSNGNTLKTSKSIGLGTSATKPGNLFPDLAEMVAAITDDVVDDVDGEYDVAYLQTILKQTLLLRYRMLIQNSKENHTAGISCITYQISPINHFLPPFICILQTDDPGSIITLFLPSSFVPRTNRSRFVTRLEKCVWLRRRSVGTVLPRTSSCVYHWDTSAPECLARTIGTSARGGSTSTWYVISDCGGRSCTLSSLSLGQYASTHDIYSNTWRIGYHEYQQ